MPYAVYTIPEVSTVGRSEEELTAIIGEGAGELIHIGQAVMAYRGSVQHFVEAVVNYPTLAECYKTAALDGLNRLDSWQTATPAPMGAPSP